jgi:hypothetical protein
LLATGGRYTIASVLAVALSLVIGFFQVADTGIIIGLAKPAQNARVVLVPPKYTEMWNKEVQQRLDNYWEIYKPDLLTNKDNVPKLYRLAYVEALRNLVTTMRREMGDGSSKYIKDATATGQFEFRGIPFGTYRLLVQSTSEGETITWSRIVDVDTSIPIFVDIGKPTS